MLVACWSSKGGAGTTVVAAALAVLLARRAAARRARRRPGRRRACRARAARPDGPGIAEWLAAGADVPADALGRLERPAGDGLAVLPRGRGDLAPDRGRGARRAARHATPRPVVADCGTDPSGVALTVAAGATRSILVTRPCFLSLRRAWRCRCDPRRWCSSSEPGRALTRADVEDCVGAPVVAEVAVDPQVARAVDAGLLATRLPRASPGSWAVPPETDHERLVERVHARLVDDRPCAVADLEHVRAEVRRRAPAAPRADVAARRPRRRGPGHGPRARSNRCWPTTPSPR